jgi:glutathione S-transferase
MTQRDLYFISGSPPCWTVMLALEFKQLEYRQKRLDNAKREQKSTAYLAINSRGQVPTLVDDDVTVSETLAILCYLDARYPSPPLFGEHAIETARVWQIICEVDGNLREPVGDISRPLFRGKAEQFVEQITKASTSVRAELGHLEDRLSSTPWLAGDMLGAADLITYPVVMQLSRALARDEAVPLELAIYPLGDHFPNLNAWDKRLAAMPGFANAYPPHWK